MSTERTAHVTWNGSLLEGSGRIDSVGTGAFGPLDVSWAARSGPPSELTSPEELLAAAHAACFSMALSHTLAGAGSPPERLETTATVTFVPGTGITRIDLAVRPPCRGSTRLRSSRPPREPGRAARSRKRSRAFPRSRSTRRWPDGSIRPARVPARPTLCHMATV